MKVTGVLSISKAKQLGYPFVPVVRNLLDFADEVIVGVDPTFPEDIEELKDSGLNPTIIASWWNRQRKEAGREIALQMDYLVGQAGKSGADWVVVLQADEFLHEKDFLPLRKMLENASPGTIGVLTQRLYFWENLNTVREDWNAELVRIFRPGFYSFLADNTDKAGMYSGKIFPGQEVIADEQIYHYSRIGDPKTISKRVRNLDSFFHCDDDLVSESNLLEYNFSKLNQFDNFSISNPPPKADGARLVEYKGTHPKVVLDYFLR